MKSTDKVLQKKFVDRIILIVVGCIVFSFGIPVRGLEGASPASVGAPSVAVRMGLNVKDFGAVGDGKHDDTDAFQNAINETGKPSALAAGVVSPKTILIPAGSYRITRSLRIDARANQQAGAKYGLSILGAGLPDRRWMSQPPSGNIRCDTEVFWDGESGGILFDIWGTGNVLLENFLMHGQGKSGVLVSVNSPNGYGSANHIFRNISMVMSDIGFQFGGKSYICSSDSSFYDITWTDCNVGFQTVSDQNLNYNFVRCTGGNTGTLFDFIKGGSATFILPSTYAVGTFLKVGAGGINAGCFTIMGLRLDGTVYQEKRTVLLNAKGETNVVLTGSQVGCACKFLWPKTEEEKIKFPPLNTPMFILGPSANVLVQGTMISGNIADLTGPEVGVPAWIQFDNCRFRVSSDPRTMIKTRGLAGYEVRNCVVVPDKGKPVMIGTLRRDPTESLMNVPMPPAHP